MAACPPAHALVGQRKVVTFEKKLFEKGQPLMSSPSRFTEKLQEALGRAQNAALSAHNQAVDVEHLLAALLEDDEGLASSVLQLAGVDRAIVRRKLADELAKVPHVTGGGTDSSQVYATQRLGRVLARAEQETGKLKDDYVSVEHVLIAMLDEPGVAGKLLREA